MPTTETRSASADLRPPRAMAWILLLASAAAVLLTGIVGTILLLRDPSRTFSSVPPRFWWSMAATCGLTIVSLTIRSLRWIFLLRRAETRIPIRDASIGYFAGLSLLLTPFLLGEIALRAMVLRRRGRVPVGTTIVVNLWERLLDLAALTTMAGGLALVLGRANWWTLLLLSGGLATAVPIIRRLCLRMATMLAQPAAGWFDQGVRPDTRRLEPFRAWAVAFLSSLLAWALPGLGFWTIARAWDVPFGVLESEYAYALSSSLGGLVLAPGGVLVAGGALIDILLAAGFPATETALTVFGIRVATVGVATALGIVFVVVHARTCGLGSASHFDDIADAYDVQIPESRREALLERKTALMDAAITAAGVGPRGLDVGCGQGAYVGRMRSLGFDVRGIDASAGQIALAERKLGALGLVSTGSVLTIPAADATYDFVYVINVLHHLGSIEEQRRAFSELLRVVRPGGLLFVHEINTRNVLFRFYMGYVFPSLNCIDEGVERWLRPDRLATYTDAPVIDIRHFTFLPEFVPRIIVRMLAPLERLLERSAFGVYSAHYMAVIQKPAHAHTRTTTRDAGPLA